MEIETYIGIAGTLLFFAWVAWDNRAALFYGKEVEMHPEQNTIPDCPVTCSPPPRTRPLHEYSALNLNSIILVKLTDRGYDVLVSRHNAYVNVISSFRVRNHDYYRQRTDENGYYRFMAWEFIKYFGEFTGLAHPDYYDINILIMNNDLTPVAP